MENNLSVNNQLATEAVEEKVQKTFSGEWAPKAELKERIRRRNRKINFFFSIISLVLTAILLVLIFKK